MPDQGPNKKPDQATKDQIFELARQGISNVQIARDLNVHGQTVNGLIFNARKRGILPQLPPKPKPEILQMTQPAIQMGLSTHPGMAAPAPQLAPAPLPQPQPQYTQPAPVSSPAAVAVLDDFSGGRPIVGSSGGFSAPSSGVKYLVERVVPPDGLLGTHFGSFSVDELGQNYGEGVYKITRHEPGRAVPIEFTQKIGQAYGASRSPNAAGNAGRPTAGSPRPFYTRPWMGGDQAGQDPASAVPQRPSFFYPRPDPAPDRSLYDFARHQQAAGDTAVSKAIEMMGTIHQESLRQAEVARRNSPESAVTKILETQQQLQNERWDQERRQAAEQRKADEDKHERQVREERERWEREHKAEQERHDRDRAAEKERFEREQAASKDAHERELARIRAEAEARTLQLKSESEDRERRDKADREERERRAAEERKFLLELEERKLALVQKDADISQRRLESELSKTREEMRALQEAAQREMQETREATERHIDNAEKRSQEQYERDKEALDREHKLRERGLDKEHDLNRQMLDIQKQQVENSSGDQLYNMLQTIVKEASKGWEKAIDLQKIKVMTPEAQTAYVASGRAMEGPPPEAQPQPMPQQQQAPPPPPPQAAPEAMQPAGQPAGAAQAPDQNAKEVAAAANAGGSHMESIIREQIQTPQAQEVIEEWSLYVESGSDATTFANLYLEMMRDPKSDERRQACAAFAAFMKVRKWAKVYKVIRPYLRPEVQVILDRPEAETFYEQFRAMVIMQIQDYWEQYVGQKIPQQQQGAPQNGAPIPPMPQAPTAAQAPVEPQGGQNGEPAAQVQGVPVPTRETLRPPQQQ